MGKRRKPVRKPNYEDIGAVQVRMAGEAMTDEQVLEALGNQVISDIRGDTRLDELMQEAQDYLPGRRQELQQMYPAPAFSKMSPLQQAIKGEGYLDTLGRLQGDVPMPIQRYRGEDEFRYHTQYRTDDTTGQELVSPVLDPNNGKALVTVYGQAGISKTAGHQSEPAMLNAGKLMGNKSYYNDPEGKGKADLLLDGPNGEERVDVMHRDLSKPLAVPLYTALTPVMDDGRMAKNYTKDKSAYNHVDKLINKKLEELGNNNIFQAVEELVSEDRLAPGGKKYRAGKLLRATPGFSSADDMYDSLLVAGYGNDLASRRGNRSQQYLPTAPDKIQKVDLREALASLQGGMEGVNVKRVANYGYTKNDYERMQLKPEFNDKAPGVVDATIAEPLLQQLLSDRSMQSRLM